MNMNATILGQAIAFAIFVLFCMKFVWPPVIAALHERQKKIADGLGLKIGDEIVVNVLGRVFMTPFDDPFAAIGRELGACPLREAADAIVVDVHCEASSEKQGLGHFCDGRASLVVGTHTHVPTADHQILPGGTAYMTDAGMTGDYDSIIGMQKDEPLRRFQSGIPSARFEPAMGEATLSGVAVETDDATGLAVKIAPLRIGGRLSPARPPFWGA